MPQPPQRNIDLSRASTGGSAEQAPRTSAQAGQASRQPAAPYRAQQRPAAAAQRPASAASSAPRNVYRREAGATPSGTRAPVQHPTQAATHTARPSGNAQSSGGTARPQSRPVSQAQQQAQSTARAQNASDFRTRTGAMGAGASGASAANSRARGGVEAARTSAQVGRGGARQPGRSAAGQTTRTGASQPARSRAGQSGRGGAQATRKKQKNKRRLIITLVSVCAVLVLCVVGLKIFLNSVINTGEMGSIAEEIKTPPQLAKEQMSLLVVGIDFTAFDGEGVKRDPIGQTDMLMYLRFNFQDNTLRMLQIPRDLFMGENAPTGGTGKLNGLYKHGENQTARVNNVAVPVSELLHLPIDGYVAIDMVSLREIVAVFGGIEVYVATEHEHEGSYVPAGWQVLEGDMLEFFLRDRYNTPTGDIGRLDTQRYFYSALFRRLRTATWQDIVKLTPVAQNYVNTDLSATDCAALAIRMLKIPSSNIMMGRVPTYDSTENYNIKHAVQVLDAAGTADVLNEYFRTPETLVTAEQYKFADWPHAEVPHKANVQWMNDVDADGGGTVGEAADGAQTGDDLLNPPASDSTAADSTAPAA